MRYQGYIFIVQYADLHLNCATCAYLKFTSNVPGVRRIIFLGRLRLAHTLALMSNDFREKAHHL